MHDTVMYIVADVVHSTAPFYVYEESYITQHKFHQAAHSREEQRFLLFISEPRKRLRNILY